MIEIWPYSTESTMTEIRPNSVELAPVKIRLCWPQPKFDWVGPDLNLVVFSRVDHDRNLVIFRRVGLDLNLAKFSRVGHDQNLVESVLAQICIRSSKSRTKFYYIQLSRLWSKIGHVQSSLSRSTNLVESTLTEIWLIRPWPKCGHIWPSRLWPKFGRIRQNRPCPKFSRIQSSRSRLKFCQVDLGPNLVTSSPTEIRSKVIQVRPILKFGLVGPDKKSVKFYGVSPMGTSFTKIIW